MSRSNKTPAANGGGPSRLQSVRLVGRRRCPWAPRWSNFICVVSTIVCAVLLAGCSPKSTRQQVIDALVKLNGKRGAEEGYTNWMIAFGPESPDEATAHRKILEAIPRVQKSPQSRTAADFTQLPRNLTLEQVIDRVGIFDRVRGSGIWYFEYDFPDGSAVLVCPDWSRAGRTNPTISVGFYRSTNEIKLPP